MCLYCKKDSDSTDWQIPKNGGYYVQEIPSCTQGPGSVNKLPVSWDKLLKIREKSRH